MKKMITISNSDFKYFIDNNMYYVDKTLLIEELFTKGDQVTLLPRPRRFGKTLNLSMLKYYFDIREESKELFKGLDIEKSKLYEKHINKYPTISLTFKDVKGLNWNEDHMKLIAEIRREYRDHKYLLESNKLDERDKKYINKVLDEEEIDYSMSILELSRLLYEHYGKEVLILLDEYDTPVNKILDNDHYKHIMNFLRNMIGSTFKGNKYLFKGVITGILKVAKESIFSGANNIAVYAILEKDFSDKFGFTEDEVFEMLKYNNLEDKINDVRSWYNGYSFGNNIIYNPFSISNYVKQKKLKGYWANTGDDSLIRDLINRSDSRIKDKLDVLIKGDSIEEEIEESVVFTRLNDPTYLWSLFLFSGYLKCTNIDRKVYKLKVPNEEIKEVYKSTMLSYFKDIIDNGDRIIDSMLKGDVESLKEEINYIVLTKLSYHDTSKNKEDFYHGLYYGILLRLEPKGYDVKSNRESGYGRYDIAVLPKDINKVGYIIEFKMAKDNVEKVAEEALKQIEEKKYITELLDRGIKSIVALGIAFKGKDICIIDKKF